jgi:hypothetical protein
MTFCTEWVNDPSLDNRAQTLMHEGAHGTAGLETKDLGYGNERRIRTLSNAEALKNTDSYILLVKVLTAPAGVVVPIGFAGDTPVGMKNPAEDRAAATALAHAEKWLITAWQDVGFAYADVNSSVVAGSWTGSSALAFNQQTLHLLAGRFSGLTDPGTSSPFVLPKAGDREILAALYDRLEKMFRTMYVRGITMKRVAAGPDTWAAVPGTTVELSDAFFALPSATAQTRRMVELLATTTPGISAALVPQYVDAADDIRKHRSLGP